MESFDRFQLAGPDPNLSEEQKRKANAERLPRTDLRRRRGCGREGRARRKATASRGICGQSAPTGNSKVQPGATERFFGDGHLNNEIDDYEFASSGITGHFAFLIETRARRGLSLR